MRPMLGYIQEGGGGLAFIKKIIEDFFNPPDVTHKHLRL